MYTTNLETVVLCGDFVADCNVTDMARLGYQVARAQEPAVVHSKRPHSSKPGLPSCHASTRPATATLRGIALRDQRRWQRSRPRLMRAINAMAFMGGSPARPQGQ
jgi:hypothetical protein